MKLRTLEDLIDCLDKEISWRKKELFTLKDGVVKSNSKLQPTAIRSGLVLLYAHWEGFFKKAAEAYLSFVNYQRLRLKDLSLNFVAICAKQKMNEFELTNKATIHNQVIDYLYNSQHEKATIKQDNVIKTDSNLNSIILKEMMAAIGIDFTPYETKANLIDEQLLKYRNNIAHGQYLEIGPKDYLILHEEIRKMIENFKTDIENAAVTQNYKR